MPEEEKQIEGEKPEEFSAKSISDKERKETEDKILEYEAKEKDFNEYLKDFSEKLNKEYQDKNKYINIETKNIKDDLTIIAVKIQYERFDRFDSEIDFYIVQKGKDAKLISESTKDYEKVDPDRHGSPGDITWRPKGSETIAKIDYHEPKENDKEIIIPTTVEMQRYLTDFTNSGVRYSDFLFSKKDLELKLEK